MKTSTAVSLYLALGAALLLSSCTTPATTTTTTHTTTTQSQMNGPAANQVSTNDRMGGGY